VPVSGSALAALITSNVDSRFASVLGKGIHPLAQKNPSYYREFCDAIGEGIISGGPIITFQTDDTGKQGSPLVQGTGAGVGIVTDPTFFIQDLYTRVRTYVIEDFGRTLHDPYPPGPTNYSGQYLLALCEGINDSFLDYYPTAWTLASIHPQIYQGTGVINDGQFSGLVATAIQASIQSFAPNFIGRFWPRLAQAISESYVLLIEQHATGQVTITGTCNSGISQMCGMSGTGNGSGTAT
jgi:hypothetical protein